MYAGLVREHENEEDPDPDLLENMKTFFKEELEKFCENDDELVEFFISLEEKKEFVK